MPWPHDPDKCITSGEWLNINPSVLYAFPQLLANRRMLRWFSADYVHNCGEDHQTCHVGYFSCIIMRGILCVLFQTFHPLLMILPRRCAVNRDWRMINLQQRHLCKQQIIFESNPCDQLLLLLLWSPKILILPGQLSAANMQHHSCAHWDWHDDYHWDAT